MLSLLAKKAPECKYTVVFFFHGEIESSLNRTLCKEHKNLPSEN